MLIGNILEKSLFDEMRKMQQLIVHRRKKPMDKSCRMLTENVKLLCSLNKLHIFNKSEKEYGKLLKNIWVV